MKVVLNEITSVRGKQEEIDRVEENKRNNFQKKNYNEGDLVNEK